MPFPEIILALCGVILLALFGIRTCLIVITVHGQSMAPALEHGDRVLALRFFPYGWIRKGRIVLVWPANDAHMPGITSVCSHIKRVVALEGETFTSPLGGQSWEIPRRHLFVCGDNHEQSIDSRKWGPLPLKNVLGLVLLKLPRKSTQSTTQFAMLLNPGLPTGQVAPAFKAQTLHGEMVTLDHFQGQNVLFLFIAVTELIRKRMPLYLALATDASVHQTRMILVSSSDIRTTGTFAQELQITLPILIAPFDKNTFFRDYRIPSIPCYCLINAEGKIQSSGRASDSFYGWKSLADAWNTGPGKSSKQTQGIERSE